MSPFLASTVHAQWGILSSAALTPLETLVDGLRFVASYLLMFGGMLLDGALQFSVDTSNFKEGGAIGGAIDAGWTIVRDLINMSFIFIILYIAINTILGTSSGADKKILGNLVIAGLLINFSKLFASLIVDLGNILALGFHAIVSEGATLTENLMTGLGFLSRFTQTSWTNSAVENFTAVGNNILLFIFIFITAIAFIYAALLFIGRIVMITFLLISSPIGFVGMILPKLNQYSKQWWSMIISQSMVAPVFLFFMFIIIKMFNSLSIVIQAAESNQQAAVMLNFAIIIAFIILAVKITKSMSGAVAGAATTVAGMAGAALLGGTALAGRAVVGGVAKGLTASKGASLEAASQSNSFTKRVAARASMATLKGAQNSSFDVRQTKAGSTAMKSLQKNVGFDVGGYQAKGGYQGAIDRAEKKKEAKVKGYEKAGFEDEAKRLKTDPGMIAGGVKEMVGEKFYNNPFVKNAFKGQVAMDRAARKMEKEKGKKEARKQKTQQIDMLGSLERKADRGEKLEVELRIINEGPNKPLKYEVIKAQNTILGPNGIPVTSTGKSRVEKDPITDAEVITISADDPRFLEELRKAKADLSEQRHDDRQPAKEEKDSDNDKNK